MSASEKLKALDAALASMKISESDQLWLDLQPEIIAVRKALPQIVAVVEAAEKTLPWNQVDANELPLRRALAALEDVLT